MNGNLSFNQKRGVYPGILGQNFKSKEDFPFTICNFTVCKTVLSMKFS